MASATSNQELNEVVFTRTFGAPIGLVWQAWTKPEHLARWWGPHAFTNPRCEIDLRPGGAMHIDMRGPDGTVYPMTGTVIEVDAPRRLVFDSAALGADGKPALEVRSIVTFTEENGRTRIHLVEQILRATEEGRGFAAGMEAGWTQSLERLGSVLSDMAGAVMAVVLDQQVLFTRVYDAPPETVWRAWVERQQIERWWGPRGFSTRTESMDVRAGGSWKFDMIGPDGQVYRNHIVYDEVDAPNKLVYRHAGEEDGDAPCHFRVTAQFERIEGSPVRTRLTFRSEFASPEALHAAESEYGAIEGGKQTLSRLGEHLEQQEAADGDEPFRLERVVRAPIDLVWKVWTEQEHLAAWFGPKGMPITACTLDFRVGGTFHYGMDVGNGNTMWGVWVFREITRPEQIAFVSSFSDEGGRVARAPFSEEWPLETLSTVRFARHAGIGGGTVITMTGTPIHATEAERRKFREMFGSMQQGWSGTFEQLESYLASQQS